MDQQSNWLDALLEQVAAGKLLPQDALEQFFLRKRAEGAAALTDEDNAFISAMDAVEVAQLIAKWCGRCAEMAGGLESITADLRRPSFFHPRRRPPLVTGQTGSGKRVMIFSPDDTAEGEYAEDCLRVAGSFSGAATDPAFLPVFTSALQTALHSRGLPVPDYLY